MEHEEEQLTNTISEEKKDLTAIEETLKTLEARILEQEHRPFKLVQNFLNRKKKWKDENDKRRSAVQKAILWRLLISPTVVAVATSGFLGYFSLYFMWKQTRLFELQNIRIEQQTHLIEADRRSSQVFIMGEVLSDINRELETPRNARHTLSSTLTGRIISLSRAMKPYRYLENDTLIEALSPERGQLLISLVESNIDSAFFEKAIVFKSNFNQADLSFANLEGGNLGTAKLIAANLSSADLTLANLRGAKLRNANLAYANLYAANLSYANLSYADLSNTNLADVKFGNTNLKGADLSFADLSLADLRKVRSLDSVKVHRDDWLTYIKDSLKLRGAKQVYENYSMDNMRIDGRTVPIIIKNEEE